MIPPSVVICVSEILFTVLTFIGLFLLYKRCHLPLRLCLRSAVFSEEDSSTNSAAVEPQGLDLEVMKSMPVIVYSAGGETKKEEGNESEEEEEMECAICLSTVEEGEKVRVLGGCGHGFHVGCIDMWFYSQATCPVCRAPVKPLDADELV